MLLSFVLHFLFSIFFLGTATARQQRKRDGQGGLKDPSAFSIPLRTDASGKYVATVGMGRHPPQNFSFLLSSASPRVMVAGEGCSSCVAQIGSASALYNASASDTDVATGTNATISMGSGVASGTIIKEDCNFKTANGSAWWYPSQPVVVASSSSGILSNGASGLLGLGRSSGNDSLIQTIFNAHPGWTNITLGVAVGAAGGAGGEGNSGVINVRDTDDSLYQGEISYHPVAVTSDQLPDNLPQDWALRMDKWSSKAGDTETVYTAGGIAIVEPYFPEIRLPQIQAALFYRDVVGASQFNDTSGLNWLLPCNSSLLFTATFGDQNFQIDSSQLIFANSSDANQNCLGAIKGWQDPAVSSYLLGSAFAETVYIVYHAERDGSDSVGLAPRDSKQHDLVGSSNLSKGAVAGIAVGSAVGAVLVALILFLMCRHQRAARVMSPISESGQKPKYTIDPWRPSQNRPANPSTPNSGTPWIIEQGPIGGDVGLTAGLLQHPSPDASPSGLSSLSPSMRKAAEASESGRGLFNTRASTTTASSAELLRNLSVSAQTQHSPGAQIHYHIHVTSPTAAAPSSFHSGGIVAPEYGDDPVPEYSERSTGDNENSRPPTAPSSAHPTHNNPFHT